MLRPTLDFPRTVDQQTEHLRAVAIGRGWVVVREFADRPNSVRKGVDRRPGQEALINAIRDRRIDIVCSSSISRIGKSQSDLIACLEACRLAGVSVWIEDRGIDAACPSGLSLFDRSQMRPTG